MEEKVNFTVVGFFVLLLSTVLIGGVLWLASGKSYRTVYDTYLIFMEESVSGLNPNAPVRYHGVEVGRVQKIALAPDNVEQVKLTLSITHGTPIKTDTVALLQTHGLTGLSYIELSGGSHNAATLTTQSGQVFPVIKTGPSLMTRLDTSVTALLGNLNRSAKNINALLDKDNLQAIKHTLSDLEILSHTLASNSTIINTGLSNAAHTLKNTARLSDKLPELARRMQRSTDAFDRMTKELGIAANNTSATLDSTQQFTHETLPEVHQLVLELRDLTQKMRHFSDELEQHPSILLRGKGNEKRGPGE